MDPGFQEVSAVLDEDVHNDADLDVAANGAIHGMAGVPASNVGGDSASYEGGDTGSKAPCELPTRQRLRAHMACMKKTRNPEGYLKATAYLKFEDHVRGGVNDPVSELMAAGSKERQVRINASKNEHNKKYWRRHRARAIICGYRFF